MQETVFLAGVVHNIGRWKGRPVEGHAERRAEMLEELAERSVRSHSLTELVAHHHRPLSKFQVGVILAILCNIERLVPPRAVVRMGRSAAGNRAAFSVELAVSLRAPEDDPVRPYLLCFAR